jgi:hypothetical protein
MDVNNYPSKQQTNKQTNKQGTRRQGECIDGADKILSEYP